MKIVVKIGSNVLTRADGTLDVTRLSAIVDQFAVLYKSGNELVVVSSGAVAAGRGQLRDSEAPMNLDPVSARQLYSAVGQAKLINRYYDLFREHKINCGQVLATKENFARRSHYLNQQHCMATMLAHGVVPIVNENDTVSVTELMFTDNDELSGLIAGMIDADRLIILSNIDGLYTGAPDHPDSVLVPKVEPGRDPSQYISSAKSTLGRGGMSSKCRIARRVASEGTEVIIANGKREGILLDLCDSRKSADVPHTTFIPSPRPASQLRKWIAHSDAFAKGNITVNQGAADAISGSRASLLPVGVTAVDGTFESGDIVTVTAPSGAILAWGRIDTDSRTATSLIGLSDRKPLIHADYLYIDEL